MTLLNPLGLLGLGLLVPVIVLHILRPRRTEHIIGSTLLWRELEKPVSAASPWQKLRPSVLLFLQLLAVVLLSLALANPAKASEAVLAGHTVFVVDASASMAATDNSNNSDATRLDDAKRRVRDLLDELPDGGTASVVAAGAESEVLVSGSSDRSAVVNAVESIRPSEVHPDWLTAFSLAESLEVPGEDIGFVLVSDGGLTTAERSLIPTGTRYERVGVNSENVSISSLSASPRGGGLVARAALHNHGKTDVVAQLRIDVDGTTAAKKRVPVPAGESVPADIEVANGERVEAFIDSPDALAVDNHAVALATRQRDLKVALVGVENPALTAVFAAMPGVKARWVTGNTNGAGEDLVVFNEVDPPDSLAAPSLVIAAPTGVPGAAVVGAVTEPAVTLVQVDDPLISNLDFTDTGIGLAQKIEASSAEVLISAEGAPLLLRSKIGSKPVVYLAFRLPDSNFYVQVTFPLFIDRVLTELARSGGTPPQSIVGSPLTVDTTTGGEVTQPNGDTVDLEPGAAAPVADSVGFWTFSPAPDSTGAAQKPVTVAFNSNPEESDIEPEVSIPIPERTRKFGTEVPSTLRSVRSWVLWALLAVLVTEWLVARRRVGVPKRQWRAANVLRAFTALAIIAALMGAQWRRGSDRVATMFVVDGSASVGAGGRSDELSWLGDALSAQPDSALAGVAIFGGDARLEATIRSNLEVDTFTTKVDSSRTNLAGALRLASAVMPEDAKRRIVLMSDGRATEGNTRQEVERLKDRGIVVDVVPIDRRSGVDVAVESVDAPSAAVAGEKVLLAAVIAATEPTKGVTVELLDTDAVIESRKVDLVAGANRVEFESVIPDGTDIARYRVTVQSGGDQVAENDSGFVAIQVTGKKRVLVVEGAAGRGTALINALRSGGLVIDSVTTDKMPNADGLSGYQSIVLADVAVSSLNDQQLDDLTVTTRDLGRGLVTVGGTHSYALGGYRESKLEELLPVISDVLDPKRRVTVAEVLAIDTSGSMGACHCGANGNGNNSGGGGVGLNEGGANKTDIARAAASRSVDALSSEDSVGILGIDNNTRWLADLTNLGTGGKGVRDAIELMRHTGDGTDLSTSLTTAADALKKSKAGLKHVILFTDGFTGDNVLRGVAEEAAALKKSGITVSVLATGETSSMELLEDIATEGGGRFYAGTNLAQIPEIMAQETIVASRNFINEGKFLPEVTSSATVIRDLKSSPELLGFIATTAKPTASPLLRIGPERDPLLVTWQNGLGRSTAWTSDISERWSKRWATWDGYVEFWTNVVKDSLPATTSDMSMTSRVVGDELRINVNSTTAFGDGSTVKAKVGGPGLDGVEVSLERESETSFSGSIPASAAGTYRVGASVTSEGAAPVVLSSLATRFYPAEFKPGAANPTLLKQISSLTRGRGAITPDQAFDSVGLTSGARSVDAAGALTLCAMLLWIAAVVISRLTLRRSAVARLEDGGAALVNTVRAKLPALPGRDRPAPIPRTKRQDRSATKAPSPPTTPQSSGTVGSLLDAKRQRGSSQASDSAPEP